MKLHIIMHERFEAIIKSLYRAFFVFIFMLLLLVLEFLDTIPDKVIEKKHGVC